MPTSPGTYVRIDGFDGTARYLTRVRDTVQRADRTRLTVGSPLPYAYGIETGSHRRGRLARRAGGAWMIRDGLREAMPRVRALLAAALDKGPQAYGLALGNAGRLIVAAIRRRTPVGARPNPRRLRDSYVVGVR